jgi:hypothetical protein
VLNEQDHHPTITCDFESNTMLLSFDKSKEDVTMGSSEILIDMEDVQEMSYFEMNDAAVHNNNNLLDHLDSFISLLANAKRLDATSRTQEYHFELEFEDDNLRDLIQDVKSSAFLTPIQTNQRH